MKNKRVVIPAIILGSIILGTSLYATGALASRGSNDKQKEEMAQDLADRLGVDKEKVATAMDEIRSEKQQARATEVSSKLDEAVSDGVITSEQKQRILDKQAEHRSQADKSREEMQQWYEDNGIDSDKIHEYIGFGGGMGRGQGNGNHSK